MGKDIKNLLGYIMEYICVNPYCSNYFAQHTDKLKIITQQ